MNRPTLVAAAAASAAACALLAHHIDFDAPPRVDRRIRRLAQWRALDRARVALRPLFPIGLPGGYITIAYATARWLNQRDARGGRAVIASAWLGWLVHRAAKLGYFRERPRRPGVRRRVDSYPSGHTTGATALALTTAFVLRNEELISPRRAFLIAIGGPAIMGTYRVIADDHWATDIAGGWLLGASIAFSCYAMLGTSKRRAPRILSVKTGTEPTSPRSSRRGRPELRLSSA